MKDLIDSYETRLQHIERKIGDLAGEMRLILEAARLDPELSVQRIRRVCEEVLIRMCREAHIDESLITRRPTLERMKGPLVSSKVIDRVLAAHIDTIISFGNIASHAIPGNLRQGEFVAAFDALLVVVDSYFAGHTKESNASSKAELARKAPASHSSRVLQDWRKSLAEGHLSCRLDGRDDVAVRDLAQVVEQYLLTHDCSAESSEDVAIAVFELASNAGRHGNPPDAIIDITFDDALGRCSVSVVSFGPAFTLREAVKKRLGPEPSRWGNHGLENIFWRGSLRVTSVDDGNKITFESMTAPKPELSQEYVPFEEQPFYFVVGNRRLSNSGMAWLVFGSDVILRNPSVDDSTDDTRLIELLFDACNHAATREVRIVNNRMDCTKQGWDIKVEGIVKAVAGRIDKDPRFLVKHPPIHNPATRLRTGRWGFLARLFRRH